MKPLAIDLFCGLGGWTDGLLSESWDVIGFDIEQHAYGEHRYPGQLVLQDVLTLHGSQFKDADLIVASPPCQEYSYMAMPWSRAKAKAAVIRADETGAELERLNRLFNACFRIQREASEAAGRHVPMVVENVRGAQPWVGRARWGFGSYYLWGDVPALMPIASARKQNPDRIHTVRGEGGSWFAQGPRGTEGACNNPARGVAVGEGRKLPGFRFDGRGGSFQTASVRAMAKPPARVSAAEPAPGRKSVGTGAEWFDQNVCSLPSASPRRKEASALIAKIPLVLSQHIARVFRPRERVAA